MSITIHSGITAGSAVCALADGSIVIAARGSTTPGRISRFAQDGTLVAERAVGRRLSGVTAHPTDPDAVVASVPTRGLLEITLDAAPTARLLAGLRGASGVVADPAGGAVLATSTRGGGRLVRAAVPAGPSSTVHVGLSRPGGLTLSPDDAATLVLELGTVRAVARVELPGGARTTLIADAGAARCVARLAVGDPRMLVGTDDGRVLLYDLDDPTAAPMVVADGLEPVWGVAGVDGDTAIVGAGGDVTLIDVPAPAPVELSMPAEPLYLSSWARVGVKTNGVDFDDLMFFVDPPTGGLVSHSRDITFDPAKPSVVLAACGQPGGYEVVCVNGTTGERYATGRFDVTDAWTGADGPPLAIIGEAENHPPDAAWGGGDPFVPQNIDVHPTHGRRRVAVVLAETSDQPALGAGAAATLRTTWQDEVFDGVTRGGVLESAARYWNDVSDGDLTLDNAGVVGPIALAGGWDGYSSPDAATGRSNGVAPFARPVIAAVRAENEQRAANGQPPLVDLRTVDSLLVVMRSIPPAPPPGTFPGRFQWPYATRPGGYQLTFEVARDVITVPTPFGGIDISIPVERTIQCICMPHDWDARDVRTIAETASHEFGHNFGLQDQYAPDDPAYPTDSADRDPGTWTVMSQERDAPEPTVPEKMLLGWVPAARVKTLSFATLGPVDEEVVLHPAEHGPAPAGRFSAVEVRLRDGENYYFEYRRNLPAETSDQAIPADFTVLGTNMVSGDTAPKDRRTLLRMRDDSDADRGEFQVGDDYEETDTSSKKYPNDFDLTVLETQPDFARLHIRYGDVKPDPQIRPWAQSTNWKSPDLEIRNARNQADPSYRDIPWEGHANTIVATVRNPGKIDAKQVRVDFFVKDYTLGSGAETPVGSDVHDVLSNATVEFRSSTPWIPPALSLFPFGLIKPHYCVVARIAEYSDPADPAVREITLDNNEAQSNHTQLISISASPSSREIGVVKVTNPHAMPADCYVTVRQTSPLSRTYLEHEWVRLDAGEEREVAFLTESMLGDPALRPYAEERKHLAYRTPNSLRLTGVADTRLGCHGDVTGGAHVTVRAARATRFVRFGNDGDVVFGRIVTVDDGTGVVGEVLVTLRRNPDDTRDEQVVQARAEDGWFRVVVPDLQRGLVVQGHYLGTIGKAPCESDRLET